MLFCSHNHRFQYWRAASLGGCGEVGPSPSVEAWARKGKDRSLQALELESGHGHQRRLWKWACFCASEVICCLTVLYLDGSLYYVPQLPCSLKQA